MKKYATAIVVGMFALTATACGSDSGGGGDDARDRLVASFVADNEAGSVDETCAREAIDRLSNDDVEIIAANLDADDVPDGLSPEAITILGDLIGCIEFDFELEE
ncbi:MAG: hypothetical protein ACE37B_05640 [Ilumatobacter sp.]|uniref:hypothetical protein n=1 Tax=Ilumatobacter sp. TaxID=1967498 RepID=UPI00391CA534